MNDETKVEPYYAIRARELVDLLHDKGFLADDCSRRSMEWLEDYIGFLFQSYSQSSARAAVLSRSLSDKGRARS